MKILGAFMVPHPPLIVDEIGKEEIEQIKKTRDSYIEIAKENDCIVSLEWTKKWSGHYKRYIYAEDDALDVFDNRIPKVYGL